MGHWRTLELVELLLGLESRGLNAEPMSDQLITGVWDSGGWKRTFDKTIRHMVPIKEGSSNREAFSSSGTMQSP